MKFLDTVEGQERFLEDMGSMLSVMAYNEYFEQGMDKRKASYIMRVWQSWRIMYQFTRQKIS